LSSTSFFGNASFESEVPSWQRWDAGHLADHRLVARTGRGGQIVGWPALAPVSDRCAYAGVAENSIDVAEAARGLGVGRRLLTALIEGAEQAGIWTVQTGVFPENEASLALHRQCGFGRRRARARRPAPWPVARRGVPGAP
jgi:L-amino acid N-acyltransferase YncA